MVAAPESLAVTSAAEWKRDEPEPHALPSGNVALSLVAVGGFAAHGFAANARILALAKGEEIEAAGSRREDVALR